jgi:hypothetical protein
MAQCFFNIDKHLMFCEQIDLDFIEPKCLENALNFLFQHVFDFTFPLVLTIY